MNTRRNKMRALTDAPERRSIPYDRVELRTDDEDDNIIHFEGYASTFQDYEMCGGPAVGGWIERIAAPAFDKTLREKPDLHFLINHAGMPIARTKSGTMQLSVDNHGLKVIADLDKRDPDVAGLAIKMERGDMDEMSFAFRVKEQKWEATDEFRDDDMALRTITEVSLHKGDVSMVNWGANPTTNGGLRSAADAVRYLAECDESELAEVRGEMSGEWLKRLAGNITGGSPSIHIENLHQGIVTQDEARAAEGIDPLDESEERNEAEEIKISIRQEDGSLIEGHNLTERNADGEIEITYSKADIVSRAKTFAALEAQYRESSPEEMRRIDVGNADMKRQMEAEDFSGMAQWPSDEEIDAIIRAEDEANKPKPGMSLRMALALLDED